MSDLEPPEQPPVEEEWLPTADEIEDDHDQGTNDGFEPEPEDIG